MASFGFCAYAQFPYTLQVFDQAIYYGMYEATVDEPVPAGAIRLSNSSYSRMLTDEQLDSFGNTLTMTVRLNPLCDNYDRIGNANLVLVPKNMTEYTYNDPSIRRIEMGRFITPFMDMTVEDPNEVPYVYDVDHLTSIFHNEDLREVYNIWIELEVYGYQGGPGQGGAAVEIPGCADRNDVYMGSLEFVSDYDDELNSDANYLRPLSYKYELKDYTLEGTDELGETVKTLTFSHTSAIQDAKIYLITSNHGSNANGEEYVRRTHYIYFDNEQVLNYKPGGVSCIPFLEYNTQINCIYYNCGQNPLQPWPDDDAYWYWNNWCPGDKIPIRVIELGDLEAGEHSFKIDVPSAVFAGDQGYFPMSVYIMGQSDVTDTEMLGKDEFLLTEFSITPNPVNNIAAISTAGQEVVSVKVSNMLGQVVLTATANQIDMSALQGGIYTVEVQFDNNRSAVKKIVKN